MSSDREVKQKLSNRTHLARFSKASSSIGLICSSLISQMVRLMSSPILLHWSMRSRKFSLFFMVSCEKGKPFSDLFRTMDQGFTLTTSKIVEAADNIDLPIAMGTKSFTVSMAAIMRVNEFITSSLCLCVSSFKKRLFCGITSSTARESAIMFRV
jgi:hypothetical protein